MTLAERSCLPCQGQIEKLSAADRDALLKKVPAWRFCTEGADGIEYLTRTFAFTEYRQAVDFTCRVAELAEAENHHPRLVLEWGQVTVDWWTHTVGGLYINDFILAARCDKLYGE